MLLAGWRAGSVGAMRAQHGRGNDTFTGMHVCVCERCYQKQPSLELMSFVVWARRRENRINFRRCHHAVECALQGLGALWGAAPAAAMALQMRESLYWTRTNAVRRLVCIHIYKVLAYIYIYKCVWYEPRCVRCLVYLRVFAFVSTAWRWCKMENFHFALCLGIK